VLNISIRGIITTLASICFSASLGRWIDHAPNRLKTLLNTITANRLSVIVACVFWIFIVGSGTGDLHERFLAAEPPVLPINSSVSGIIKKAFFAAVLILGVFEKLSGAANMMSMERDWVVTVAAPDGQDHDLTRLNAVMRRIDLICKLVAPIVLSIIISASESVQVGVLVVGGMSAASWTIEWWCARRVWKNSPKLQRPKVVQDVRNDSAMAETLEELPALSRVRSQDYGLAQKTTQWFLQYAQDLTQYFSLHVWIPSLALSLLHLSALSYSATFITYLLNVGFSLNLITIARAVGSVVEISSTIVTPFGISYLGKAHHHRLPPQYEGEDSESALVEESPEHHGSTETGLERLGLWGITWQLVNLVSHEPLYLSAHQLTLPGPRGPHTLGPLARHPLLATLSPIPHIPQNHNHISPRYDPRAPPPRPPSLRLPLRLASWPVDLRPHNATTNANTRPALFPVLFRGRRELFRLVL
jgi:solute carrier family 40 (iron-regulated transporter), member 1